MERNFMRMLHAQWVKEKFVCVGLDSEFEKIPDHLKNPEKTDKLPDPETLPWQVIRNFNNQIVDATKEIAACYKPNLAFYLSEGTNGLRALIASVGYIKTVAPDVPVILDAKFGDIGNTNEHYAKFAFDKVGADAVTVHNFMGAEGMKPFLNRKDKGVIVLCRTSNPGSDEFQGIGRYEVGEDPKETDIVGEKVFLQVAKNVADPKKWDYNSNCMLVMGATYTSEFRAVRTLTQTPFLVPGIGAQGGDLENAVRNSMTEDGNGFIINSSRGIIFASKGEDFATRAAEETRKLNDEINTVRLKVLEERTAKVE